MDAVWREFDARYRPVLCGIARNVGLTPTDAEEVAQATLVDFVRAYRQGSYDRSKGRLSTWIIAIAYNRIATHWRSQGRAKQRRGDSALQDLPNRPHLTRMWAAEQQRVIFARAWELLRTAGRTSETTLKAFELAAIRGTPPAVVAAECGMTLDEVYVAKTRVSKRLRELVKELTAAYGEEP